MVSDPARDATARQRQAADPRRSTWLAANAGAGKTRVLTQRVARLLMEGVAPQSILCLTYTKAAAGEMQNRLFAMLGTWAMLPDAKLAATLADLGDPAPQGARLAAARRLFAAAIETPGGLKIQTIHAFCAALLRQFPLEAGVGPGFAELDEASARALRDEVLEAVADGPRGAALTEAALHLGDDAALDRLVAAMLGAREGFDPAPDRWAAWRAHGLPEGFDEAQRLAEVFGPDDPALIAQLVPALAEGAKTDQTAAAHMARIGAAPFTASDLDALDAALLTAAGTPRKNLPTKATRSRLGPALTDRLAALSDRVATARMRQRALGAARRTQAMHELAAVLLPEIARRKDALGRLDFDDLILRARRLLSDPAAAAWVLWKLDGAVDHILVDEAQDTSPTQWEVIALLAQEMTAGAGDRDRSLFVVGDPKQSIYSFQGADPGRFTAMRERFAAGLAAVGAPLQNAKLEHSFRSSPAILAAVDRTFAGETARLHPPPHHIAGRSDLPGRVDLWPVVPRPEAPAQPPWYAPVDRLAEDAADTQLARAIAGELRQLIDAATPVPRTDGAARPLSAGDVLILVQRRGPLCREILRACKAEGLAIAGADRLRLTDDLAVKDLLSLVAFLALPEDDLALAEVLRSPLLGWSEDALYRLAQPRKGGLWEALRTAPEDASGARAMLQDLLDRADFLRPFDLLERVLTRHGGRTRLLARLGSDCEEALDALLSEALRYETQQVPTLTGFLGWIGEDAAEIRRQSEEAGSRLRVMTVHGAKGLEAPLVILPDCADRRPAELPPVLPGSDGPPLWLGPKADRPPAEDAAAEAWAARDLEERDRLLYVAMTRAETWLWVAAAGNAGGKCWHGRVAAALAAEGAADHPFPTGDGGLRLARGDWPSEAKPAKPAGASADPLPAWARRPAPVEPECPPPLLPSGLGGAKVLPGAPAEESGEDALRRGRQIHLLLEHLPGTPAAGWQAMVPELLRSAGEPADAATCAALLGEVAAVLTDPTLGHLFGPDSLAEVALTAPLSETRGRRLRGSVDRLVVAGDQVLAVDFKTNLLVPKIPEEVPEGLLRQMGAYARALAAVYPGHTVATGLLWTAAPRLMQLPAAVTNAAFERALAEAPLDGDVGNS